MIRLSELISKGGHADIDNFPMTEDDAAPMVTNPKTGKKIKATSVSKDHPAYAEARTALKAAATARAAARKATARAALQKARTEKQQLGKFKHEHPFAYSARKFLGRHPKLHKWLEKEVALHRQENQHD